jgi:hypothetical protein
VRVKMNREAAFGATVKQQQARGQTVCQVKDYQSRELRFQQKNTLCLATTSDCFTRMTAPNVFSRWSTLKKYSRFILRIQFEICSLGSEDRSTLAVETQRDQEQHPCQPQQIVIDGSQTAGDVQAFNSATCCTTISQYIYGILASAITALVFLSRSPITFSGTPKLWCLLFGRQMCWQPFASSNESNFCIDLACLVRD